GGFAFNVNGQQTFLNISLPSNPSTITSISIGNTINNDGSLPLTVYYILPNGEIESVKGTISFLDFGCQCKKRVSFKEEAEVSFLKLMNHLWQKNKTIDGVPVPVYNNQTNQ